MVRQQELYLLNYHLKEALLIKVKGEVPQHKILLYIYITVKKYLFFICLSLNPLRLHQLPEYYKLDRST